MPAFVASAYARRILSRHGWVAAGADYEQVRRAALDELPLNVLLFNDFHAQLVWLGQEWCRTRPRCDGCPLESFLPPSESTETSCNPSGRQRHARKSE